MSVGVHLFINGPAGVQLGTSAADVPASLGEVTYPVGVIAGTRTVNPILSQYLPNPDDGKVSVARARVRGMADFITISATHPFIMRNELAIAQAITFLREGGFSHGLHEQSKPEQKTPASRGNVE